MASIHTFKYDEEQIYLMRYSGMVHGNNFYRPWFAEKTGAKSCGEDIDLDVSDLRYGLFSGTAVPSAAETELSGQRVRLYLLYLYGRIPLRKFFETARRLPMGLQPCKAQYQRIDPP